MKYLFNFINSSTNQIILKINFYLNNVMMQIIYSGLREKKKLINIEIISNENPSD